MSPIISIVFNMITVRVGLARDQAISAQAARPGAESLGFRESRPPYGSQSLAVEITHFIETDDHTSDNSAVISPGEIKAQENAFPSTSIPRMQDKCRVVDSVP